MAISNPCGVAHFQNKPCRECDRIRRRSSGPEVSKLSTSAVPADLDSPDSRDQSNVPAVSSRGNAKKLVVDIPLNVRIVAISTSDGSTTNAERCRRWRTSGDVEEKREANKLRMRKKRDG